MVEVALAEHHHMGSQQSLVGVAGFGMVLVAGCKVGCKVDAQAEPSVLAVHLPQRVHKERGLECEMGQPGWL